ncbi:alpha-amylase family glycosyl hydrolase [Pontiellaceae bacterium B12227]|nr:alpha-amylase family glycosyl hydrolase [Pontiellaceae bacterium B12227]
MLRKYKADRTIPVRSAFRRILSILVLGVSLLAGPIQAETVLQYFGTPWTEITARMPELAEAGWTALWLPPPFKAGSQFSVGFDTFDRFDLGSKDQMGGVSTLHGTEAELLEMMETAHRFGIRVYFDNVMAHNGGSIPGYDENTSIFIQPGFVPEDFHLKTTEDGFYRKMPDYPDYNDEWQVLNRNPFGLDIAHEDPNTSFGAYEGAQFPKYHGIRHPDNPEYYLDTDIQIGTNDDGDPVYTFANNEPFEDIGYGAENTGAGNGTFDWDDANGNGQHDAGETSEPFTDTGLDPDRPGWKDVAHGLGDGIYNMGNPVSEDVNSLLYRAIRWFIDKAHVDGFRLDAVKHVPYYFFGKTYDPKDSSNWGYNGQIQEQFNITHGYSDWSNHRDSLFNTDQGRDDAMLFGEHLGEPPSKDGYLSAGMRIADNDLYNSLSYAVAGYGSLAGYDAAGYGTYGVNEAMMYSGSHDFNFISLYDRPSAHALILTRAGLPIVYTDGYNETQYPDSGGKYFPQHGDNPFLGQFGDNHLLNLLYINQLFARGEQNPKWSDDSYVAYERRDWRETGIEGNAVILSYMMARNGAGGQSRSWTTSFPEGARLYNYSKYGGGFYANVSGGEIKDDSGYNPIVPAGGFFAFSWRVPEMPAVWDDGTFGEIQPLEILQDGQPVETMQHVRTDGYAGDPDFNPYSVPGDTAGDYQYALPIPRITNGSNLTFIARADGSAENILIKLDGGMDVNAHMGLGSQSDDLRDRLPALSYDMVVGYEDMQFNHRMAEKFAAKDVTRNVIGSPGAETYEATIGTAGFTVNNGSGPNTYNGTVTWAYHDPADNNESAQLQFSPGPESAAGSNITVWVKAGYTNQVQQAYLYYTTDGTTYPEGSAGIGKGTTQVAELSFNHNGSPDEAGTPVWWKGTLPAQTSDTVVRYKIGVSRLDASSIFPYNADDIYKKKPMETMFSITNFNATTVAYRPHNDFGTEKTGLKEGYHVLRTKAFLNRGGAASLFNLNVRTFYYDTKRPEGEIIYPGSDGDTLFGSTYGFVVRSDESVEEVCYRITDSDAGNDDTATGVDQGNGTWIPALTVDTSLAVDSDYPQEWRFDYNNIPASGTAQIEIRLKEASSSTNNALSDADGHYTTLVRNVNTSGPDVRFFTAWPQQDGETVGPDYVAKIHFSKSLAVGLTEEELLNTLTLSIDGVSQPRSDYSILYNETSDYHALAFTMDNYFNNVADYQHTLEVLCNRDGEPLLTARRIFLSYPIIEPYVNVVTPPLTDELGDPFRIVLPDVASPVATQRQYTVYIETDTDAQNVAMAFEQGSGMLTEDAGNPVSNSNYLGWSFTWNFPLTNDAAQIEGTFRLRADVDTDGNTNTVEATALREARVILREISNVSTNDFDDDDDGLSDFDEITPKALPTTAVTEWVNSDVHAWNIYGLTDATSPDTDGDGLPDGLESGWRLPADTNATLTTTDTNGDGYPNFIGDLDPPFYNTFDNYGLVPGVSTYSAGTKTDLKAGTMTDAANPDTDYDGLPDGLEDANRNGWVDGDGEAIPPDWNPWLGRDWPDGSLDGNDVWLETDPNNADTDQDGLSDGYGEDQNANGIIDGDTNGDRLYTAGEAWQETDPLNSDTDADGLPDGWEVTYGFNPLDNGTDDLSTASATDGDPQQGAAGDVDNDGTSNLEELINGTNPQVPDSGTPPPPPSIVIGPQDEIVVGAVANAQEFSDWNDEDLIALDTYDELESTSGGDVYYRSWASDGLESSRDMLAFYAQDGGSISNGGDGNFYFRLDMMDLVANAEESGLDIYVVIDTGNTAIGERKIVDNIDVLTDMRWEAVVAVYDSDNGAVYVNQPGSADTDTLEDTIVYDPTDVDRRTQAHADGFKQAYFNSELDSIEFSISRQALIDTGWNGNFAQLNFQVFTTRDGTDGGDGELDGPDIQDSIRTDWIAEDFSGITSGDVDQLRYDARIELESLVQWVGINADNDRGKQIKIIPLIHGNQHIQPGNVIQDLINDGAGAGFYRPLDTHEAFAAPLSMHITPTLASAIQWASVDPAAALPERDGPALNNRVASLISSEIIDLTGSTFSDHLMPYFTPAYNANNVALASEFLNDLYGPSAVSTNVFWTPERVIDHDVLTKIQALGFDYTFIDQSQHLYRWFGIDESAGNNAYRINSVNGINCIPISNKLDDFRFQSLDGGASLSFRKTLSRRVQSGTWNGQHPQVLTLLMNWQDFNNASNADHYDQLIRWLSSKGWIKLVTADQVAGNEVDLSMPPDGTGDVWNRVERGTGLTLDKTGHDWIQYSAQGNYDNWYLGSALNEGIYNKMFESRPGSSIPQNYGMLYLGGTVSNSWESIQQITDPDSKLAKLAQATLHASVFETAFHQQTHDVNMTKFSSGEFVYPDTTFDWLADFARTAQSQSRMAAVYQRVDQWAAAPPANAVASIEDIDLDGVGEYLLYNTNVFALIEESGGRMTAAWIKSPLDGEVYQMIGNYISDSDSETEFEGDTQVDAGGNVIARRTSCMKDLYAVGTSNTTMYVNDLYTGTNATGQTGWKLTSSDGKITKTITLSDTDVAFDVSYSLGGDLSLLYIRNGLSPNLLDLLKHGQQDLADLTVNGGALSLANTSATGAVTAAITLGPNAVYNASAVDDGSTFGYDYSTINMRNQAQTHQVEISGSGTFAYSLGFGFDGIDSDGDGVPDDFELQYDFLDPDSGSDASADEDNDGVNNGGEYIAGTELNNNADFPAINAIQADTPGITLHFSTEYGRNYYVWYKNNSVAASNVWNLATSVPMVGNGGVQSWTDNGGQTSPAPDDSGLPARFYKIEIEYP